MTGSEGLAMTGSEGLAMTGSEGLAMTGSEGLAMTPLVIARSPSVDGRRSNLIERAGLVVA